MWPTQYHTPPQKVGCWTFIRCLACKRYKMRSSEHQVSEHSWLHLVWVCRYLCLYHHESPHPGLHLSYPGGGLPGSEIYALQWVHIWIIWHVLSENQQHWSKTLSQILSEFLHVIPVEWLLLTIHALKKKNIFAVQSKPTDNCIAYSWLQTTHLPSKWCETILWHFMFYLLLSQLQPHHHFWMELWPW